MDDNDDNDDVEDDDDDDNVTGSVLDLALTSDASSISNMTVDSFPPFDSDHLPLRVELASEFMYTIAQQSTYCADGSTSFPLHRILYRVPNVVTHRAEFHHSSDCYRHAVTSLLDGWLSRWSAGQLSGAPSVINTAYAELCQILESVGRAVLGVKSHTYTNRRYYTDPRIVDAIAVCHTAVKRHSLNPTNANAHQRNLARKQRDRVISDVRKEYWNDFRDLLEDDQHKIVWDIWKRNKGRPVTASHSLDELASCFASVSDVTASSVASHAATDARVDECIDSEDNPGTNACPFGDALFSKKEVKQACEHAPLSTALGPDNISPFFLRTGGGSLHLALRRLFNAIWISGVTPQLWRLADVVALHKKGDKMDPNNYRPVSLTSVIVRMFERMIQTRLLTIVGPSLHPLQFGFRKQHATQDSLLLLQHRISAACATSNHHLPVAFLDLKKAFDKVHHRSLLYKLSRMGERSIVDIYSILPNGS